MNDRPQPPNNGKEIRLPRIGGPNSCDCVETLVSKMNKRRMKCTGIGVMKAPSGDCIKGLRAVTSAWLVNGKDRHSLIQFNFCPFCGGDLRPVDDVPS